ncbi:hypothetical protein [Syntrophus sp. (in: bacteria)]|uniref:hypothetical protein n=1 Tax=Syntrophus sp. (in: bacteria) TaxID=48412 RepID=UPI00345E443D
MVEGFSRPALIGGLEELVNSAAGFTTLDLELLEEVLSRYDMAKLWAATGWFLERFQNVFHVPDALLTRMEYTVHVPGRTSSAGSGAASLSNAGT